MLKRFLVVFALVLFAGCIALLPRLVYGAGSNTSPSLSISVAYPPDPNPVAVGNATGPFVTVSFQVDASAGNNQGESPSQNLSINGERYTITSASGGIITSAGTEGFTTSGTGTSTVTISGGGGTSFEISATLYYPQSAAGTDTITCSGTLYMSDGSQVGSSPNGSAQVTAVAVDSITLNPDPSTQNVATAAGTDNETFNYQIGQTITRSDFTIATTPSGYGSNTKLVSFSPSSFALAVGDNNITATCGVSTASLDVIGVQCSGSWTSAKLDPSTGDITAGFNAGIDGNSGTYSTSGPDVIQPASGNLQDGVGATDQTIMYPASQSNTQDNLTVEASQSGGGGSSASPMGTEAPSAGATQLAAGAGTPETAGLIKDVIKFDWETANPTTTPAQPPTLLAIGTAVPQNYIGLNGAAQVRASASWSEGGYAKYGWIPPQYYFTSAPSFQISVGNTSAGNATVTNTVNGNHFQFYTNCQMAQPSIDISQFPLGEAAQFLGGKNVLNDSFCGPSQVSGQLGGITGITDCDGSAWLSTVNADAGWPASNTSSVAIQANWDPLG
ncbi:MAG: hypothetical protein ACP5I8_13565 [Phycisphaerae bacterium]